MTRNPAMLARVERWCARHGLSDEQACALLLGLMPLGLRLWCPDDATAELRLEGGGRGVATLTAWWAARCAGEEM